MKGIGRCQTSTVFLSFCQMYLSKYHKAIFLRAHQIYFSHFFGMKGELVKGNRQVLVINCPEGTRQVSEARVKSTNEGLNEIKSKHMKRSVGLLWSASISNVFELRSFGTPFCLWRSWINFIQFLPSNYGVLG